MPHARWSCCPIISYFGLQVNARLITLFAIRKRCRPIYHKFVRRRITLMPHIIMLLATQWHCRPVSSFFGGLQDSSRCCRPMTLLSYSIIVLPCKLITLLAARWYFCPISCFFCIARLNSSYQHVVGHPMKFPPSIIFLPYKTRCCCRHLRTLPPI